MAKTRQECEKYGDAVILKRRGAVFVSARMLEDNVHGVEALNVEDLACNRNRS